MSCCSLSIALSLSPSLLQSLPLLLSPSLSLSVCPYKHINIQDRHQVLLIFTCLEHVHTHQCIHISQSHAFISLFFSSREKGDFNC